MSDEYSEFDCPAFHGSILVRLRSPAVCYYRAGSSIVGMELDEDIASAVMGEPQDVGISTLLSVTDPATGRTKAVNRGLALGWIFFIVFWMLLVVAIGLVILLCVLKKKLIDGKESRFEPVEIYDSSYMSQVEYGSKVESESPLQSLGLAPAPTTMKAAPPPVPSKPSKESVVSCRIMHYYDASDESVLQANKGDTVRCQPKDFADDSDWVWARAGGHEGYVPREALMRIN